MNHQPVNVAGHDVAVNLSKSNLTAPGGAEG